MKNPNVNLHIDELVLHGFPAGDRSRIGEAVRLELARLFAEQGVPAALLRGGTLPGLNAGMFEMGPGARANTIGDQVAQSVYRGLHR